MDNKVFCYLLVKGNFALGSGDQIINIANIYVLTMYHIPSFKAKINGKYE